MEHIYTSEEIAKQRELDKIAKEKEWEALAEQAGGGARGKGIADAFKKLYTLYTPELAEWFAKLYDPEVGGYYSTTSGHDTEGFGPDVEVTVQSLRFIESSGMLREVGSLKDALPEGMGKAMVRFAKSLQHTNGYFYHPQWSFEDVHYNLSRRGRDLGWATSLIETFGGTPTYDTPNGRKGDGLDADGNPVEMPMSCGGCDEPKPDAHAAAKNYPEYLENKETFLRYLETVKIRENSYWWGNQFNATYSQIKARNDALIAEGADYSLCEILINWLNERIDPNTGYWGGEVNMAGSNGFFKIITLYNAWRYVYPMPEKVTESVLHNIMGDEIPSGNCCSIYNLWSGICSIKSNVKINPDEAVREKVLATINETLRDMGAEAILNTYKKVAPYMKNGVEFSHSYTQGGGTQQGLYTGLNLKYGVLEGNVDATCICTTGMTRTMFEAFGFRKVSLLMKADWMNYRNILLTYGPAKKTRKQNPDVSFETGVIPGTVNPLGDSELKVEGGELKVPVGEGRGVLIDYTARTGAGNCALFEADMKISDFNGKGKVRLGTRYGKDALSNFIDISVNEGKLTIGNGKWDIGFNAVDCASADSFKLRFEIYLDGSKRLDGEAKLCSGARVYVDGKLLGSCVNNDGTDPSFPSTSTFTSMAVISIAGVEGAEATVAFKNLRFFKTTI